MERIADIIKMKELTKEERKTYIGPSREAASTYFRVDPFDEEIMSIEISPEATQDGNTLPVLRSYGDGTGNVYYMLVLTDSQLSTLRNVSTMTIVETLLREGDSGDIKESYLRLGEINVFFTETGVHSLDPKEEINSKKYIRTKKCYVESIDDTDYTYVLSLNGFNEGIVVPLEEKYRVKRSHNTVLIPLVSYA